MFAELRQPWFSRTAIASFVAVAAGLLAGPAKAGDVIYVPIRWCGVEGAPSMANPGVVNEATSDDVLWRRHERPTDQIYLPQLDMNFRSGATKAIKDGPQSFPIIRDPAGSGGDIVVTTGEYSDAVTMCRRAWSMGDPLYYDANNNGVVESGTDTLLSTMSANIGIVGLGHGGATLVAAPGDVRFVDANSNGTFEVGEPVYRDENNNGSVDGGDTLLVNTLETTVGNVNAADLGRPLLLLPSQVKYIDLIRAPANTFNIGYPNVQGITAVNANDLDYPGLGFPVHGIGGGLAAVMDDSSQYLPPGPNFTMFETQLVAHEFGHGFSLNHGDGFDDNMDGLLDNGDDPAAPFTGAGPGTLCDDNNVMQYCWRDLGTPGNPNMMFIGVGASTPGHFTTLQRNVVRNFVLTNVPDRIVDPIVPPLVATRADDLGEISPPNDHLDISEIEVRVDDQRTNSTFSIQTRRAFPRNSQEVSTFFFLADVDRNPRTGGQADALRALGVPTDFAGAEYLGIVALQGRNVANVAFFAHDDRERAFVNLSNSGARATVETLESIIDFPFGVGALDPDRTAEPWTPIPSAEIIRLVLPIATLRLDEQSSIRIEFISQGPQPGVIDRARSTAIDFAPPVFPECRVEPQIARRGSSATVLASGLLPSSPIHLLLGPNEVAVGRSDANGNATLSMPIAVDATLGQRLVTVGAIAVTADCVVVVEDGADGVSDVGVPGARYVYAAQFLCGYSQGWLEEGVAPGQYQTLLTLTNASSQRVEFAKRVSQAYPRQEPGGLSAFVRGLIEPHRSIAIECNEIEDSLQAGKGQLFHAGTILIVSRERLEITAVYSSGPPEREASTVQVVPITPQPVGESP